MIIDPGVSNDAPDGKYTITNITLQYDIIQSEDFAASIRNSFSNRSYPYTKFIEYVLNDYNKKIAWLNINVNTPNCVITSFMFNICRSQH